MRETAVSAISDQTDAPCRRTSRPSFGAMTSWWKRSIGSQMRNVDPFAGRRAAEPPSRCPTTENALPHSTKRARERW